MPHPIMDAFGSESSRILKMLTFYCGKAILSLCSCFLEIFVILKWLSTLQVGTVLSVEDAKKAVGAGAKFLMSPAMVKVSLYFWPIIFPYFLISSHDF